jgi:hypothetical protein
MPEQVVSAHKVVIDDAGHLQGIVSLPSINAIFTVVCLFVALCIAASHTAFRAGFPDLQITEAFKGLLLISTFLGTPSLIRCIGLSLPAQADSLVICVTIALCILAGTVAPPAVSLVVLTLLACSGFIACVRELPRLSGRKWMLLLAASVILGTWASAYLFGQSVHDPLVLEMRSVHGGRSDDLFHSALVQNLQTYGLISTGLDGTPPFSYHTASHRIFALLSNLLGSHPLDFYLAVYPVFALPLFCKAFLTAVNEARAAFTNRWSLQDVTSLTFWTVTLVVLVGCLPLPVRKFAAGLAWGQPFASESHTTSMTIFFLGLAIIAFLARHNAVSSWLNVLFVPAWLMLLTATKVPWLVTGPLIAGFLWLRDKRLRTPQFTLMIPLAVAAAYYANTLSKASECQGGLKISYWDWFKYTGLPGHDAEFMAFYFLPFWSVIAFSLITFGVRASFSLTKRETVLPQLVVGLWAMFFLLTNVIELKAAAGIYFLDPVRWMALFTLMTLVCFEYMKRWSGALRKTVAALAIVLVVANTITEVAAAAKRNARDRRALAAAKEAPHSNATMQILQRLRELHSIPVADRRQTLVFIPQTCEPFWTMCHDRYGPFTTPSLSGIAMLDGVLPVGKEEEAFGFQSYTKRVPNEPQKTDKSSLLERATKLGFKRVIALDWKDDTLIEKLYVSP